VYGGDRGVRFDSADYNRDGRIDYASIRVHGGGLRLLTGVGVNAAGEDLFVGTYGQLFFNTVDVKFIDLNGDGYSGIIFSQDGLMYRDETVAGPGPYQVVPFYLPLNPDGTLNPWAPRNQIGRVAVGDLDNDGDQDVAAIGNRHNPFLKVFLNQEGTLVEGGTFLAATNFAWDSSSLHIADLDGDGLKDIALSLFEWSSFPNVWKNLGNTTFAPVFTANIFNARNFQLADLDGDGDLDIFTMGSLAEGGVMNWSSPYAVRLFRNEGSMVFTHSALNVFPPGQTAYTMDAADMDGDGLADVVLSLLNSNDYWDYSSRRLSVLGGDGLGGFSEIWGLSSYDKDGVPLIIDYLTVVKHRNGKAIATGGYYRSYLFGIFDPPVTYSWVSGEFGACSATCGGGTRERTVSCMGSDGSFGSSERCASQAQPPSVEACNTQACPLACVVASLGFDECSAACDGGTQTEILQIITPASNGGAVCRDPIIQACNTQSCDSDSDSLPDTVDACPATELGARVDENGCSGVQNIRRACPMTRTYENHGAYVSCVAHASDLADSAGLITQTERAAIQGAAARSSIGKK
jgi:hypothetical protein